VPLKAKAKLKEPAPLQSQAWFEALGWIHIPASWQAWLLSLLLLAFGISVFMLISTHTDSFVDAFYVFFPYGAVLFLLQEWVASKTS
jgi:hypothetical protein